MDQIYPDNGLVYLLLSGLNNGGSGWLWHLFSSNTTPSLTDTISSYTEASWSGYSSISVAATSYTLTGVSAHTGFAIAGLITFGNTSGSPQSAYGYYVTDASNTVLLAAARFDAAPLTVPSGVGLSVLPNVGDFSGLSS